MRKVFLKYFTPQESTNVFQEEEDKNLSLGMLVQNQEDDGNDEQLENEELDLPTSPSTYDSNTQTQKPFVIYENPCYDECETKNSMALYDNPCYYDGTNNSPSLFKATSEFIDDDEECCLQYAIR